MRKRPVARCLAAQRCDVRCAMCDVRCAMCDARCAVSAGNRTTVGLTAIVCDLVAKASDRTSTPSWGRVKQR